MLYNTTQETTEMEAEHIFHLATIRQIQSISNKPKNERGSLRSQATALHRDNTKTVKVDRDHELFSQGNYFFSKSQQVRDFF